MMLSKNEVRMKRKTRIRKRLSGTSERPRLVVFRSNLHIYAQIIDDMTGSTLAQASTLVLSKNGDKVACNKAGAEKVGKEVARIAKEKTSLKLFLIAMATFIMVASRLSPTVRVKVA